MEARLKALHIGGDKQDMIIKHLKTRAAEQQKRCVHILWLVFSYTYVND